MNKMQFCLFSALLISLSGCAAKLPSTQKLLSQPSGTDASSVETIYKTISDNASKFPSNTLAVTDFTDIYGNETHEGKVLAEQLATRLSQNLKLRVIERRQLEKILSEQKLQLTGITEEDSQKIGKILNVDVIVAGTIVETENSAEINARVIDVKTGQIYCAENIKTQIMRHSLAVERKPVIDDFAGPENLSSPELAKHRKELLTLREDDPLSFRMVVGIIRETENLKKNRPKLFIMLTEPEDSPKLEFLKVRNPLLFERLRGLKNKLDFVFNKTPSYRAHVFSERERVLILLKGNDYEDER